MIIIVHENAETITLIKRDDQEIPILSYNVVDEFWKLGEKFPEDLILWVEKRFFNDLNFIELNNIFHHDLILASYAVENKFLPDSLGYIDQLPFIKVNREQKYPTWQMSSDIGGIKGSVLHKFHYLFKNKKNFQVLLNSIGKIGQQNGLFCYSVPDLINGVKKIPKPQASKNQIFHFVYSHYKTVRLFILFWCYIKYEKSFPLLPFLTAFLREKKFRKNIDFSDFKINCQTSAVPASIDVIIPTLGRKEMLLQVLEDLKSQNFLPSKVIVVEQNADPESRSELPELQEKVWPFKVVHQFTHTVGACKSRNIALEEVEGEYVFFADDDIRLSPNLLENSIGELQRLNISCLNINCKQKGEETEFKKIKQWGSFGSGTSIVKTTYCKNLKFDEIFEYGFGEDMDYGMQLRNIGCDIIYHPELEILHLKAPIGGFRDKIDKPWERDKPKPSPTLMVFAEKYYTPEQMKGFKTELFLRFYNKQKIKNPFKYLKRMGERWKKSEKWAEDLISRSAHPVEK